MWKAFTRSPGYQYSAINKPPGAWRSSISSLCRRIIAVILIVILATGCFFAGRYSKDVESGDFIHLSTKPKTFVYNRTYGDVPSNTTDQAWESIFPTQGGFFKHPDLAPRRSALSVFHQLHCLNGMRTAYWQLFTAATTGTKLEETSLQMEASPPHFRHCVDLIRNSLMCRPDLTIEIKDPVGGGVSGFGTEHKCQDWEQMIDWVSKWQWWRIEEERELYRGKESEHMHSHGD